MFKSIGLALTTDLIHKRIRLELLQYAMLNLALFFVPFLLGHPQLLVGSLVNAMLIYIAVNFKGYRLVPAIFLPALAVLSQGLIFGSLTKYLAILVPFIWAGNFILIISVRFFLLRKRSQLISFAFSSFLKALFLFAVTALFVLLFDFPRIFLLAMGPVQLLTALAGSGINLVVTLVQNKLK